MKGAVNNRALLAAIATAAIAAAAFVFVRSRQPATTDEDQSPPEVTVEKRIELMFDAAQRGDVAAYKACFTDPLLSQLDAAGEKLTPAALRKMEVGLKGFSGAQKSVDDDEATIIVEKIYPEHNERHRLRLKRIDGEWKITEIQGLDKRAPVVPFGTPVVPGLEMKGKSDERAANQ